MSEYSRVVDLEEGRMMVVTDLHGNWDLYCRYRDRFLELQAADEVDTLVLTGDFIHNMDPAIPDDSLDITIDLIGLKDEIGDKLIVLMGNHEFPHLYSIPIQKGNVVFTPQFERDLGIHREKVLSFFNGLPFFIRTAAGVSISHAGASPVFGPEEDFKAIFNYAHDQVWQRAENTLPEDLRDSFRQSFENLNGQPYDAMARKMIAVSGPDDPRYDDFLIGAIVQTLPEFNALWDTLFNKNEYQFGEEEYEMHLAKTLQALSENFFEQRFLVCGHTIVSNGHRIVAKRQLRLASGVHAQPFESARFLLFDAKIALTSIDQLLLGIRSIFS